MPNVDLDYQESNDVLSLGYDDTSEDTDEVQELLSGTASEEPADQETEADSDDEFNLASDEKMQEEYDNTFSGEEQVDQLLSRISGKVKTRLLEIPVDSIILPKVKKKMRQKSIIGLTGLVTTLSGVVTPIHVMSMEDSDDEYTLLDGARRLFATVKAGNTTINAVVWDFEDKKEGRSLANILGLLLNRSEQFKNSEIWDTMQVLEIANNCTPGKIEYLLQMPSGDAMKMRDVMLAEGDSGVQEVKEKLLNDELTIDAAYKKLNSLRKKENRLERDENRELALEPEHTTENSEAQEPAKQRLSNDEVLELLEMGTEDVSDQTLESLKAKGEEFMDDQPVVQEVGKRHPVDPAIRTATFRRDNFKCKCCGIGDELFLSILVFHHLIPVFAGGPDTVDNGLTLCANCHLTLHNYVDGHLHGDLAKYSEKDQQTLKNIFKYGNVARAAAKKMGLKREQVHKLDAQSRQHYMPNLNVKANDEAFLAASKAPDEEESEDECEE